MSDKKKSTSLLSEIVHLGLKGCGWFFSKFLPKVGKFIWDKMSFPTSGFILEVIENKRGTSIHPLRRRLFKNLFSLIIFILILAVAAILVKIFS